MKKLKMKKYSDGTKEAEVKKKKPEEMTDEELKTAKKNAVAVANRTTDTSIANKHADTAAKTNQGGELNDRDKRVLQAKERAKELDKEYQRRNGVNAKGQKPKLKNGTKAIKKMKLKK